VTIRDRQQPAWYSKIVRLLRESPRTAEQLRKVVHLSFHGYNDLLRPHACPRVDQADALARSIGFNIHVLPHGIDRPPCNLPELVEVARKMNLALVPLEAPTIIPRHERRRPDQLQEAISLAAAGARVILAADGHDIAAVIPLDDLRRLEQARPK
jgi:hypothetical protein